jgi:hypothetical protein
MFCFFQTIPNPLMGKGAVNHQKSEPSGRKIGQEGGRQMERALDVG